MKIARFEPWPYVDLLQHDADRSFAHQTAADWRPAVDIVEGKDRFLLRADVPGVESTAIDVSMDAGVLTIAGVRHLEENDEGTELQRSERSSGRFLRRFTLPESSDADGITAKTLNGILEVSIPKQAQVQPRRITVEAA